MTMNGIDIKAWVGGKILCAQCCARPGRRHQLPIRRKQIIPIELVDIYSTILDEVVARDQHLIRRDDLPTRQEVIDERNDFIWFLD